MTDAVGNLTCLGILFVSFFDTVIFFNIIAISAISLDRNIDYEKSQYCQPYPNTRWNRRPAGLLGFLEGLAHTIAVIPYL